MNATETTTDPARATAEALVDADLLTGRLKDRPQLLRYWKKTQAGLYDHLVRLKLAEARASSAKEDSAELERLKHGIDAAERGGFLHRNGSESKNTRQPTGERKALPAGRWLEMNNGCVLDRDTGTQMTLARARKLGYEG